MNNNGNITDTSALAELSRLKLSEGELSELERDMEKIVSFAKKVCESAESEKTFTVKRKNVLRADSPSLKIKRKRLLSAAPRGGVLSHYYAVPRVVD